MTINIINKYYIIVKLISLISISFYQFKTIPINILLTINFYFNYYIFTITKKIYKIFYLKIINILNIFIKFKELLY